MTDQRTRRLVKHFGLEQGDAEKLVAAGFYTPRRIKAAKVKDLDKVIGRSAREKARKALTRK